MQSMILQGIEMPFQFQEKDEDIKAANIQNKVCGILSEIEGAEESNIHCSDQVDIYSPCPECGKDRSYYGITINGGLNGDGIWSNYFDSISKVLARLEADPEFEDVWVITMLTDCADDVFSVQIGIYPAENY